MRRPSVSFGLLVLVLGSLPACSTMDRPALARAHHDLETPEVDLARPTRSAVELDVGRDLSFTPLVALADFDRTLLMVTRHGELLAVDQGTRTLIGSRLCDGLDRAALMSISPATGTLAWVAGDEVHVALAGERQRAGVAGKIAGPAVEPEVIPDAGDVSAIALSPAGDLLALARGDAVEVRAVPGLEVVKRARLPEGGPRSTAALVWDPDGARLAACGRGGLAVLGGQDLRTLQTTSRPGTLLMAAAFSPDGTALAFGGEPREVEVLDIAAGSTRTLVQMQPFGVTTLAYSPDGQVIAAGDESCDVWGYEITSGNRVMHGKHHKECYVTCAVWAQDGTLLFGCREHAPGDTQDAPTPVFGSAPKDLTASVDLVRAAPVGR